MRAMLAAHVDAVLAIECEIQHFPWTRGNFCDALASGYLCRVDETLNGSIRGYAVLMVAADEAELLNIGVATRWQRHGVARALLAELFSLAWRQNLKRMFLEVRISNVAAIALYRSIGFSETGIRRGYYRNEEGSEDALMMMRELSAEVISRGDAFDLHRKTPMDGHAGHLP